MSVFAIVAPESDVPVYEVEFAGKRDNAAHLSQFIIHAALDLVDEREWKEQAFYLKKVDSFNDFSISCYVLPGRLRFMLLHELRSDDSIKHFFQDVHALYIKVLLNPWYAAGTKITSAGFDARVRALGKKHL